MIDILAKQGSVIQIGHSGENEAVRVCFSLKLFQQAFPGGTPSLHVKRNGDQSSYPVVLDVDGAFAFWIVSEADTANAGIGECEIHWTVNDILAKTDRFKFLVREALSGGSEPPDPAGKAWYDKIESEIGDLSELKTAEKSSLVGAINEAAEQELPDVSAETNDMALFNNGEKAEWREIPPSVKDWNETDPNSDAYIKNRTHGQGLETATVVPKQEITATEKDGVYLGTLSGCDMDSLKSMFRAEDALFDVVFDGLSHSCRWIDRDGNRAAAFGNPSIVEPDEPSTGEPFIVVFGSLDKPSIIACETAGSHTISVNGRWLVIHTLDPKYLGDVTDGILTISGTSEFAADSWKEDFSSFSDSWLVWNAGKHPISIEINGKMFKNLPYTPGAMGAFMLGDVDTIGVSIENAGRGNTTQWVHVSSKMFPNGITSARVYRTVPLRIPDNSLPEKAEWVLDITGGNVVTKDDRGFVRLYDVIQVERNNSNTLTPCIRITDHNIMMIITPSGTSYYNYHKNVVGVWENGKEVIKAVRNTDGSRPTPSDWPLGCTLIGFDWTNNPILLNPRYPSKDLILPSSTEGSSKKFKITVDDMGTLSATEVT